ncbi:hypothetical protein [Paracoccus sp. (in: a-proteobacteria)]|uniref:hypothetical protein n=1 Tax=Paracoccus sp. TaxID=267 RepID=UPI003A8BD5F5
MTVHSFNFLILERDNLVARDMSEGFAAISRDSRFKHFKNTSQILEYIEKKGNDLENPVVVTKLPIAEIDATGLTNATEGIGSRVVVRMESNAPEEVSARGWYGLAAPFSSDDLADLVRELLTRVA